MLRISVSLEAYQAIAKSLLEGQKSHPPEPDEWGGVKLWLDRQTHVALNKARLPGESLSEAILRLVRAGATAPVAR